MITVIKRHGKPVQAYRLGESSPTLSQLIESGKIIPLPDGNYEVMSREAIHGNSGHGETARKGDYIKVDSDGYPYPICPDFFEANHTHVKDNEYRQNPSPMSAWTMDQPMCPEIEFLQQQKGLIINREDFAHAFTAPLWGTLESAPGDSVLVFYSITYSEDHTVTDADYNFVVRQEFDKSYKILSGGV